MRRGNHQVFLLVLVMLTMPFLSFAQNLITGRIFSNVDQTPIPGATILVKGTKLGTASGLDGTFSIKAKQGDVLVISGIGVTKQEIPVGGDNNLQIAVATNSKNLNEVVITATGIKKEAKRLGYSIQSVDASTLTKAREPDPVNSLKGNV
ncbi:MAG TPA: carboxypeptidase-like regulatory domain-containing protein, partial [Puia sp.]|nr:carboxypeptidase-like regulatory domain-containing protein [Puia sp.]